MTTIPASDRSMSYAPVAATGPFPIDFPLFDETGADLYVTLDGVEVSGWTFTGTVESGFYGAPNTWVNGSITFATPISGELLINGDRDPRRQAQFAEGRGVPARDQNTEWNILTAIAQEFRRRLGTLDRPGGSILSRLLRARSGETVNEIPILSQRAGRLLGFDSGGNPIAIAVDVGGVDPDAAFMTFTQTGAGAVQRTVDSKLKSDVSVSALDFYLPTDSGIQQAINRAIDAVRTRGTDGNGGRVVVPNLGSSYAVTGKIILKGNITLEGDGMPTLRLANGVNETIIEGVDFLSLSGTNSGAGAHGWALRNLILDGNRANNVAPAANQGHCVAVFGRDFTIETVEAYGAARRGVHIEYGNTDVGISPYNGAVFDLLVDTTGEDGFYNAVSDLHANSINVRTPSQNSDNTFDAINLVRAIHATNINVWMGGSSGIFHRYSLNIGLNAGGSTIASCHLETAKTAQILLQGATCMLDSVESYNLLGNDHLILDSSRNKISLNAFAGGFGPENVAANCVRVINSRTTNDVDVNAAGVTGPLFVFTSSFGGNKWRGRAYTTANYTPFTGKPHPTDHMDLAITGGSSNEHKSQVKYGASSSSITGNGSTQADAALITRTVSRLFPSGANAAFKLPPAVAGTIIIASNVGGGSAVIFPSAGDNHHGSVANASVNLGAGLKAMYVAHSDTEWIAV